MKIFGVRDGKRVAPVCPECGCRFSIGNKDLNVVTLLHFGFGLSNKDARGCECSLVNNAYLWDSKSHKIQGIITLTPNTHLT